MQARLRNRIALLLSIGVTIAWAQCDPVTQREIDGIERAGGDEVYAYNVAWLEGYNSWLWSPWVVSSMGRDALTIRPETIEIGAWGGIAVIEWSERPSRQGVGNYWHQAEAYFESYCGYWDWFFPITHSLLVQRPTISGLNGAWYFGPNFIANNGYYDATLLTANPNYPYKV